MFKRATFWHSVEVKDVYPMKNAFNPRGSTVSIGLIV